jgi:hypothetical protein
MNQLCTTVNVMRKCASEVNIMTIMFNAIYDKGYTADGVPSAGINFFNNQQIY